MATPPKLDKKFHFLSVNHSLGDRDRRKWELDKAKALSHSAKVAYRARKSKAQKQHDDHALSYPQSLENIGAGRLDPFVAVSMDLTSMERDLLHGYLVSVPRAFYGTSATSPFCPVRDVTLGVLSTNQILLSWAILFMQYRRAVVRNLDPDHDTLLLRRRQLTYKILSTKIDDQLSVLSEDVMYGLAFSALLENRIGDKETAQKHLQACLVTRCLRLQKGLTVLSYPRGILCIPVCIQVGVPDYFKSIGEVRRAGFAMKETFRSIQEWKESHRRRSLSRCTIDTIDTHSGHASPLDSEQAQTHQSSLGQHLTRAVGETTPTGVRLCLALLFTLNLASWQFHQHGLLSTEFLQLIAYGFGEGSSTSKPDGVPQTALGMVYNTFACINRMQLSPSGRGCHIDLWQTVDVVGLLMLAAPSSRARVKLQLMSWLLDESQDTTGSMACDDIFHKHIVEDIEDAWLSHRPSEVHALHEDASRLSLPMPPQQACAISACSTLPEAMLVQSQHANFKYPWHQDNRVMEVSRTVGTSEQPEVWQAAPTCPPATSTPVATATLHLFHNEVSATVSSPDTA